MASLNQVSIELKVGGEQQATQALDRFAKSNKRVGSSVGEVARKVSGIEGEFRSLINLQDRGVVKTNELSGAYGKLVAQLRIATGMTGAQARTALDAVRVSQEQANADKIAAQAAKAAAQARREQEAADKRAAQAAEQLVRAQRNLEGSVLRQSQAVNQSVARMEELQRLKASGSVGSRNMAQAELEIARALARTNGYLKSNGALNTQKALAELRAAQATRNAAAAEAAKTAEMKRVQQSYNQLRAAIDPAYAARMRLKQAADTLRAAERQGLITRQQAIEQLRLYRDAAQQAAAGGGFMGRSISRAGVLTQQAGYQVGDFIVQVQSGTNAFIAFGQQATQIAGTLTLLGGRYIAIGTALGVTIPLLTALGAGLMRANVEADAIYEKFGFLEGSLRGLSSAFGEAGGVIVNIVMTIVRNLDVFVSILGVAAVAATVKFIAATSAMGTVMTSLGLMFTTTGGAALVAASATTALTAAMARLMAVISAHPIIAAMTAALALAVVVLYRARDASDGFRSNVEGLSDALKELRDNAKKAGIEAARIELGADTSAQAIAMQRITELTAQIAEQEERVAKSAGYNRKNTILKLKALIAEREEIERLLELDEKRVRLMESAVAKSSLDAIISSYDEQYALQIKIADAEEKLNEAVRLQLIDQERMAEIMDEYVASLTDSEKTAKKIGEELDAHVKAYQDYQDLVAGITRSQEDQLALAQEVALYGKDSVEVARLRAEQEALSKGLVGDSVQEYIDLEMKIRAVEQSTEDVVVAAEKISPALQSAIDQANDFSSAMSRAANSAAGINISTAGINAEIAALESGANRAEARAAAAATTEREKLTATLPSFEAGPRSSAQIDKLVQETYDATLKKEQALERRRELTSTPSSGTASATQEDYLAKLRQEADLKLSMIGLSEQEQRRLEIENDLKQKGLSIEDKRIDQVLRAENALRMAQEAEKRREDIMNVVTNNIESALMSVVDGTKSVEDAFKGMLRTIILEIYKQQVAQPIAQGAGAFLSSFFANGGAFNRGNVIPFANGGVVGSPTTFPMANGNTGLMGEAGPEAIMPLKRGKDGKLGVATDGGGNVNIVQNFNISANGDDSVKRIVRQQIPQIAEATKAAVVDSKRRGGSYGRAFG